MHILKEVTGYFDFIIDTAYARHDINANLGLLKTNGVYVCIGVPSEPSPLSDFGITGGRRSLADSSIGGLPKTREMLNHCAEHNIISDIELIAMKDIETMYDRMVKCDVKYRFITDMATL